MLFGSQGRKQLAALGGVGLIGIEMAVSILVGRLGGTWLDTKLGTAPWLARIGFVLGVVAGFRGLYRLAMKEQARLTKEVEDDAKLESEKAAEQEARDEIPDDPP